jgi:hypothetical protein
VSVRSETIRYGELEGVVAGEVPGVEEGVLCSLREPRREGRELKPVDSEVRRGRGGTSGRDWADGNCSRFVAISVSSLGVFDWNARDMFSQMRVHISFVNLKPFVVTRLTRELQAICDKYSFSCKTQLTNKSNMSSRRKSTISMKFVYISTNERKAAKHVVLSHVLSEVITSVFPLL